MKPNHRQQLGIAFVLFLTTPMALSQTFTKLVDFDYTNGSHPQIMSMVQGADGSLYGTTSEGGNHRNGVVFKVNAEGDVFVADDIKGHVGVGPVAGLILSSEGGFYGTAEFGGGDYGSVFKVSPEGRFAELWGFSDFAQGAYPEAALVQAANGYFYGTTMDGGNGNNGTVFRVSATGDFVTLHQFSRTDGMSPLGQMVQGWDGDLYGTTDEGGPQGCSGNGCGTIFRITPAGDLITVHSFDLADGVYPSGPLIQASDGDFYGTTYGGGGNGHGGTVYKVTAKGNLTTVYSFCALPSCNDGDRPEGGVIEGTDGNFYGTTEFGTEQFGTVFRVTPSGVLTTLHTFNGADGVYPKGGLVQATNGRFYGATYGGGDDSCDPSFYGCGTVFSLDMGLAPFVALVRDAGKVGGSGGILGQGFTGTTAVSLNGTPAQFQVVSDTFIRATVPPGATTGYVTVTTPSGILKSNVQFHVIP